MNLTGTTLGQYRVVDHLGRGGMADVYKAYHDGLAVYRAIKVIRSELITEGDFKARFSTEAKAVAKLRHPNIVQVQDFCAEEGRYYMVMEYVEGKNLKQCIVDDGPIRPIEHAVNMIGQLASALHYAHQQGIIHRDIKPQNIIIDANGDPVLTDFGIAKLTASNTQLTQTGMSIGTPAYMAPEQALADRDIGPAADIYSLSVVLYETLTGKVPFDADTPLATMLKAMHDPLPLPKEVCGEISDSLQRVILKGMAKKPDDRYATALAFKSALEAALTAGDAINTTVLLGQKGDGSDATAKLTTGGKRKSSRWPAVAALALLLVVAGAAWFYDSNTEPDRLATRSGTIVRDTVTNNKDSKTGAESSGTNKQRATASAVTTKQPVATATAKQGREKLKSIEVDSIKANTLVIGDKATGVASAASKAALQRETAQRETVQAEAVQTEALTKDAAEDQPASIAMTTPVVEKHSETAFDEVASPPAVPVLTTAALDVNKKTSGTLERAGQKFIYTFDEYAGENIYLDHKSDASQQLTYHLIAPDGRTTIFTSDADSGPWKLSQTGDYTLEVAAKTNAKIDFEFVLWRLFPAVIDDGELTLNRYTKNATKFPGQKVVYEFSATEGQRVYFDEQHVGNQLTDYRLIAPDRRTKVFETNKDVGPLTLPQSGRYRLEVDPTADHTVEFAFVLRKQ